MQRSSIYGNWRAKVVDNKDKEKFGRVLVWIPDLMPEVPEDEGIWARPANNPIGGRNTENDSEHHYMGTSFIPKKGSWIWIFFEGGNINKPYYFGSLDLENTQVLPENQVGSNYEDKWTLFKSHEGRAVVISDDPDDARVEITGKKRKLTSPPTGDTSSVFQISENMTTILLDERKSKQKLLIKTYKEDYIHIDIDERKLQIYFKDDMEIKTDGKLFFTAKDDIHIRSEIGDIYVTAKAGEFNLLSGQDTKVTAGGDISERSEKNHLIDAVEQIHRRSGGNMNHDAGGTKYEQSGTSSLATQATEATAATPEGKRDT